MDYDSRALGRVIVRLRRQRGMTQEVLSGLAGTARSNLAGIEKGGRDTALQTFCRIAEGLGLRPSELMRMAEEAMGQGRRAPDGKRKIDNAVESDII